MMEKDLTKVIKISEEVRTALDALKRGGADTYDSVIRRLMEHWGQQQSTMLDQPVGRAHVSNLGSGDHGTKSR